MSCAPGVPEHFDLKKMGFALSGCVVTLVTLPYQNIWSTEDADLRIYCHFLLDTNAPILGHHDCGRLWQEGTLINLFSAFLISLWLCEDKSVCHMHIKTTDKIIFCVSWL